MINTNMILLRTLVLVGCKDKTPEMMQKRAFMSNMNSRGPALHLYRLIRPFSYKKIIETLGMRYNIVKSQIRDNEQK